MRLARWALLDFVARDGRHRAAASHYRRDECLHLLHGHGEGQSKVLPTGLPRDNPCEYYRFHLRPFKLRYQRQNGASPDARRGETRRDWLMRAMQQAREEPRDALSGSGWGGSGTQHPPLPGAEE